MHQIIMDIRGIIVPTGYVIHHIYHIKHDNRYSNLQIVLVLHNGQSKLKGNKGTSRYYGVSHRSKNYQATVKINGVHYHNIYLFLYFLSICFVHYVILILFED